MGLEEKFKKKEIVYGPMACGKSLELMRRIKQLEHFAKKFGYAINIFKPTLDKRGAKSVEEHALTQLISRTGLRQEAHVMLVNCAEDILQYFLSQRKDNGYDKKTLVAIDEVQLLNSAIIDIAEKLRQRNCYVLMGGLDLSFRGKPFPFSDFKYTMHDLITSIPEEGRHKLTAFCDMCGETADYTQRLLNGKPAPYYDALIKIGYGDYEARCTKHFEIPGKDHYHFVYHIIKNTPGITITDLKDLCNTVGKINPDIVHQIINNLCTEQHTHQQDGKLYAPTIILAETPHIIHGSD